MVTASKNASNGEGYTDEEYENFFTLSENASLLSDNLTHLYGDIQNGSISISELTGAEAATE